MGFRDEFSKPHRLPERVRQRAVIVLRLRPAACGRDRIRSCDFPGFARDLAIG